MRSPTLRHLEALRQELNASRPQCPVGLSTLAFPSLPRSHRSVSNVPRRSPSGCSSSFTCIGASCNAAVHVSPQPRGASALGLPHLRPRPRAARLGPEVRGRGAAARGRGLDHPPRMPAVPQRGPLRAPVAGLRAGRVRGRRSSHSRLCAVRPRLLGEDSQVLGGDAAPARDARLQGRLPLLLRRPKHPRLDAAYLPGPHRLAAPPLGNHRPSNGRMPGLRPPRSRWSVFRCDRSGGRFRVVTAGVHQTPSFVVPGCSPQLSPRPRLSLRAGIRCREKTIINHQSSLRQYLV